MGIYAKDIQKLYIAYFNRPADVLGLAYWEEQVTKAGGNVAAVANAFSASKEYQDLYAGKSTAQVIDAIYQNLFGRPAELDGLTYWGTRLDNGTFNIGNIAMSIQIGAQGDDKLVIDNKTAAADSFTTSLDTSAEVIAYSGNAANAVAKQWLATVGSTAASLTAATTSMASTVSTITSSTVANGSTFTLTTGVDNIVGSGNNDVISAVVATDGVTSLGALDSVDGGAGTDTLNLVVGGAAALPTSATVKNVEVVNIAGANNITGGVDAAYFAGSTTINIKSAGANVTVSNMSGKTLGVEGKTTGTVTGDFGATAASATVALNAASNAAGTGNAAVALTGAALKTANISGSGKATITSTGALETLNVNATGATTLDVSGSAASLKTINAASSTGGITLANPTVTTGSASSAVTTTTYLTAVETINTGAGDDTFTVSLTTAGKTATVDSGAGKDTITVNATQKVNVNAGAGNDSIAFTRAITANDVVNGGDGSDTLTIANTTVSAGDIEIIKAVVQNVETLKFAAAVTGINANSLSQFTGFSFTTGTNSITKVADAQTVTTTADVTVTAAGYIPKGTDGATATTYAGALKVVASGGATGAGNGSDVVAYADSIDLSVNATAATATAAGTASFATLAGDVKTATVHLTNSVNAVTTATPTADVLANFSLTTAATQNGGNEFTALGNLTSLTLTGNGQATIVNGAKLATVDATGMTGKAAFGGTAITGGLDFTGKNDLAETIKLGGGKDIVRTASTYDKIDTIENLSLVAGTTAGTLDTAKSDDIAIGTTGFAKTTVTGSTLGLAFTTAGASTTADKVVFQYDGNTYVYVDVGSNGLDNADIAVKIVGTVDLDLLVLALNA